MDETQISQTAASAAAFASTVVTWLRDRLAHPVTGDAITWTRSAQAGVGGPTAQNVFETSIDGWAVTLTRGGYIVPSGYISRYGGSVSSSVATTASIAITNPEGDLIGFHADSEGPVDALFTSVSAAHERGTAASRQAFLRQIAAELPDLSEPADPAEPTGASDAAPDTRPQYEL